MLRYFNSFKELKSVWAAKSSAEAKNTTIVFTRGELIKAIIAPREES
jgi:hypothetical protein